MALDQDMIHDEVLPHLQDVLDTSMMQSLFQVTMFGETQAQNSYRIRDCEILHIRYKRRRYCLVLYRLTIENHAHQCLGKQMLCGRMFQPGESQDKFLAAQIEPPVNPTFGKSLFHLPTCEMVIWAFPNDRKLFSLSSLTNLHQLQWQILPQILEFQLGAGFTIQHLTTDIAHYVPEHTCMFRVSLQVSQKENVEEEHLILYGKAYYNKQGAETYRLMQQLWNSETRLKGHLLIPQPLWYDRSLNTLWQSSLAGSPLSSYDLHHSHMNSWLEEAGKTVAALHQTPVRELKQIQMSDLLAKLEEATWHLSGVRPSCRPALNRLVGYLLRQAKDLQPQPQATLHGDLHRKNLFVQGETIGLIDLDSLCTGPALHDIGSFWASLYFRITLAEISESQAKELMTHFVEGYQSHMPWSIPASDLAWHIAMSLITEQAYRCGTTFKANRLDVIDDLIEYARTLITGEIDKETRTQTACTNTTCEELGA